MAIEQVVDAMLDMIKKNMIAKTTLTADINVGDTVVSVANSFHFDNNQEIVLIDNGYNTAGSSHYQKYEYAVVKTVNDTNTITLKTPALSSWLVADSAFIQKTIGHVPLYEENVLYGDREVIPTNEMAITVEPVSLSNEWIYIQGGLSEEYRLTIMIYGKSVETEEGMRILNKYSDAVYKLINSNLHININDYQTPLLSDINSGDTTVVIEDTDENRENFIISTEPPNEYQFQDNNGASCIWYAIVNRTISGGQITLTFNEPIAGDYLKSDFAVLTKLKRYFYDSRVDSLTWGLTQKGSAVLRAAELSWFGKEVEEYSFPQTDKRVIYFSEKP